MQPNLAFAYNSGFGNGHLGVGWALDGFSAVHRCPKTLADDGVVAPIRYDANDSLCIDGERLMLVSGTYGTHGAEYRTRRDRYAKIVQYRTLQEDTHCGADGWGVVFEVRTKDGRIHTYGVEKGPQDNVCFNGKTNRWPIRRTRDRSGNFLDYVYTSEPFSEASPPIQSQSEHRPHAILYAHGANGVPTRAVTFTWSDPEEEPRLDGQLSFRDGVPTTHARLLKSVKTFAFNQPFNQLVRSYELDFHHENTSRRSLLGAITECDGHEQCKGPTRFTYRDALPVNPDPESSPLNFAAPTTPTSYHNASLPPVEGPGTELSYERLLFLDLNADGSTDLLVAGRGNRHWPEAAEEYKNWHAWMGYGPNGEFAGTNYNSVPISPAAANFQPNFQLYNDPHGVGEPTPAPSPRPSPKYATVAIDMDNDGRDDFVSVDGDLIMQYGGVEHHLSGDSLTLWARQATDDAVSVTLGKGQFDRIWAAAFPDLNGDGLNDVLLCVGGYTPPGDGDQSIGPTRNWGEVEPRWHYGLNVLGAPPPPSDSDLQRHFDFVATDVPCSRLDELLVLDRDGDGTQELLVVPLYDSTWNRIPDEERTHYHALEIDFDSQTAVFVDAGLPRDRTQRWMPEAADNTAHYRACMFYRSPRDQAYLGGGFGYDKLLDVNGDGLVDIIRFEHPEGDGFDITSEIMALYQAPSYDECVDQLRHSWAGDLRLYINTGHGFVRGDKIHPAVYSNGLPIPMRWPTFLVSVPIDYDGDGRMDLALPRQTAGEWQALTAKAAPDEGYFAREALPGLPQVGGLTRTASFNAVDINGDGLHDIVSIRYFAGVEPQLSVGQFINVARHSDMLVNVRDGTGGHVIFEYSLSNDAEVVHLDHDFAEDECNTVLNRTSCFAAKRPIVRRMLLDDALDADSWYTHAYEYWNGHFDRHGRGWLGFQRIRTIEGSTGPLGVQSITERVFDNTTYDASLRDYPFAHHEKEVWVRQRLATGHPAYTAKKTIAWATHLHPANAEVYAVLPETVRKEEWQTAASLCGGELEGVPYCNDANLGDQWPSKSAQTSYVFDEYGNATDVLHEFATDLPDEYFVTETDYLNDPGLWLIGLPTEQRRTSAVYGLNWWEPIETITREAEFEHDLSNGLLKSLTVAPGVLNAQLKTELIRDAHGNVEIERSTPMIGASRQRRVVWDAEGVFPVKHINEEGHEDDFSYDPGLGVITQHVDPNGVTVTTEHDGFGRVVNVKTAAFDGVPSGAQVAVEYLPLASGSGMRVRESSAGGAGVTTDYDRLLRPVMVRTVGLDGLPSIQTARYDAFFRMSSVGLPFVEGGDEPVHRYNTTYDVQGRPILEFAPDLTVVSYEYQTAGGQMRVVDQEGHATEYWLNRQGGLSRVDDANGSVTRYGYGAFGTPQTVLKPDGSLLEITYDNYGRRTSVQDDAIGLREFFTNAWSEVHQEIDANGEEISYRYDRLGRVTTRTASDGTLRWLWDDYSPKYVEATNFGIGKLRAVVGADGAARVYEYDKFSRPAYSVAENIPAIEGVWYNYDAFSRPAGVVAQGQFGTLGYERHYDANGHLQSLTNSGGAHAYWKAISADAAGRITQEAFGNDVTTQLGWNEFSGKLLRLDTHAGSNPLQAMEFEWTARGSLERRTDEIHAQSETLVYDSLGRLARSTVVRGQATNVVDFAYDEIGNIATRSDVGIFDYVDGRLIAAGGNLYEYDGNGNTKKRHAGEEFHYTSFGKVASYSAATSSVEYLYDGNGQRVQKLESSDSEGDSTTWYFDDLLEIRYDEDGDALAAKLYVHGPGGRVVAVLHAKDGAAPQPFYLHHDHIGSTDLVTASDGNVAQRMSFDAWGARRSPENWVLADEFLDMFGMNRGFAGHHFDLEAGLINTGGRMYDPLIGRFISPDPFVVDPYDARGFARYSYAYNDPLTMTDSTGMFVDVIVTGIAKLGSAIAGLVGSAAASGQFDRRGADPYTHGQRDTVSTHRQGMGPKQIQRPHVLSSPSGPGTEQSFGLFGSRAMYEQATEGWGSLGAWYNDPDPDATWDRLFGNFKASLGILSVMVESTPAVGTGKSATEVWTGRDAITNEPTSRTWAAVSVIASFIPGGALAVRGVRWIKYAARYGPKKLLPGLRIGNKQFGKKLAKHAKEFGLDPSNAAHRQWVRNRIENIVGRYDEVRQGPWNPKGGGGYDYLFYRQGDDVVLTKVSGDFVTVMPGGSANGWFKDATPLF